jgi:type I pantothenate kinase
VDAFGSHIWATINGVNLIENIQPTRARANLVLHKGADHRVTRVRLRRF